MIKRVIAVLLLFIFCSNSLAYASNTSFWKRKHTFEKKVYRVGRDIAKRNHIHKHIVFSVKRNKNINIVNAFADSVNIEVSIHKGFLNYMESDDELAAVLSHEIAHLINFHQKRRTHKIVTIMPLLIIESIISPFCPLSNMLLKNWTRSDEYEADITGTDLMVKAGYDPNAALVILSKVITDPQGSDFGESHPFARDRLSILNSYIKTKYPEFNNSPYRKRFEEECILSEYQSNKNPKIGPAPIENYDMFTSPATESL